MILGVPWWVFVMIICIFLSGYMAFRTMRADQRLQQQFIEREGKVYMDRMEAERQYRNEQRERQISD
ncbi:sporulation YhaL family protein [Virgibacillus sp. NKC19-16]|uniref:sporulation YhaL family protein n=1 Tax=Virgibacillus salidurans TaxID=2831673 RepID=UPI001F3C5439|nr:sporulation YhaL family protein [Virgibacillus sp. NKC19-16]UJL47565.1 sporulation YhaL family protein [Virgibacillus sp. NKC19-16]